MATVAKCIGHFDEFTVIAQAQAQCNHDELGTNTTMWDHFVLSGSVLGILYRMQVVGENLKENMALTAKPNCRLQIAMDCVVQLMQNKTKASGLETL